MKQIRQLFIELCIGRQIRQQMRQRIAQQIVRKPEHVILRQVLAALPDRSLNRRVILREIALSYLQRSCQFVSRYVSRKRNRCVIDRAIGNQAWKVAMRILVDLHGREKRNIKIP